MLDIAQRFLVAVGAIRQGVAERIERLAVLGVAGENGAQIPFQHVNAVEPLGHQRPGVQEILVVGVQSQCPVQRIEGFLITLPLSQCLGFG